MHSCFLHQHRSLQRQAATPAVRQPYRLSDDDSGVMKVIKMLLMTTTLTFRGLDISNTDPRDLIFLTVHSNGQTPRKMSDSLRLSRSYIFLSKSYPTNQFLLCAAFCLLFCPPSSAVRTSSVCIQTGQSFSRSSQSLGIAVLLREGESVQCVQALQRGVFLCIKRI